MKVRRRFGPNIQDRCSRCGRWFNTNPSLAHLGLLRRGWFVYLCEPCER